MNILKTILRGIFYFCTGIKTALADFCEWFTANRSIPRILRNRASLVVLTVAVVAGGWGLVSSMGNANNERRVIGSVSSQEEESSSEPSKAPDETSSEEEVLLDVPSEPAFSEGESSAAAADPNVSQASADAPSSSTPAIDTMAGATRFKPVQSEQLSLLLKKRVKTYQENPVNTPPKAGDIAAWKKVNPDVFGWITIPNTNINLPVVYHQNVNFYTSRGYYKESSRNGVIWADSDTRFDAKGEITSRNTTLYGHNWTNCWRPVRIGNPGDVMFGQLAAYDNAEFAKANNFIRFATTGGDHLYQVFAVFYTDLSFGYNYADGAVVNQIINTAKAKDIHKFNVPVGANDQILTLSTCTRVLGPTDAQRFVVMAKKVS